IQLGAEFSRRDELRRKLSLAGVRQNSRVLHIAQNECKFRPDLPCRDGVGNCDKVRTLARAEHADAEWFIQSHGTLLQVRRLRRQASIGETQASVKASKRCERRRLIASGWDWQSRAFRSAPFSRDIARQ